MHARRFAVKFLQTSLKEFQKALVSSWQAIRNQHHVRLIAGTTRYYAVNLFREMRGRDVFLWAQAIAFKVLITMVPVVILATGVLGQILQRDKPFATTAAFIRTVLPPETSESYIEFIRELASTGTALSVVGGVALVITAARLITTLRATVGNVFEGRLHDDRSILRGYLFDLRMVGQVGLFFVLSVSLTAVAQTIDAVGIGLLERIGLDTAWLLAGYQQIIQLVGVLLPFLLTTAIFFQLFYFIPTPRPPQVSALVGGLFAAVLWEAAKSGFTFYATHVGRFDRYSAGEGTQNAIGDTFGLIIAFVLWVYYSGVVLLMGAIIAHLNEQRFNRQDSRETREEDGNGDSQDGAMTD